MKSRLFFNRRRKYFGSPSPRKFGPKTNATSIKRWLNLWGEGELEMIKVTRGVAIKSECHWASALSLTKSIDLSLDVQNQRLTIRRV